MFRAAGHAAEATTAWVLYLCFAILPVDAAAALGGWIGRPFGSRLSVSNNARRNLKSIYPDWSDHQVETVVISMWDNLGRTAAEHPHLSRFNPYNKNSRVEVVGLDICEKIFKGRYTLPIFFWPYRELGNITSCNNRPRNNREFGLPPR